MINNINTNKSLGHTLLKYTIEIFKGIFPYLFVSVNLLPINKKPRQNPADYNQQLSAFLAKNKKKLLYKMNNIDDNHLYYENYNKNNLPYYKKYKLNIMSTPKNKLSNNDSLLKDKGSLFNHKQVNGRKIYRSLSQHKIERNNAVQDIDFFKYKR